jgi:hypothetical protein
MANVNLTPDMITREALRILHQKLNFVGNVHRDYDDRYANEGGKIGDSLRVRLPYQYSTGTGATMATGTGADSIGVSTTLQISAQRHVPMRFTSEELTLDIEDFSSRHIEPAMAVLAAKVEADVLGTAVAGASNFINAGTKVEFADVMDCRKELVKNLAPENNRCAILNPQAMVDLVVDNKSLFQDQAQLAKQYREGMMGRFGSFDFYENTLVPAMAAHTAGGTNTYDVASDGQEKTLSASDSDPNNQTLAIDTGTKVIAKGAKFTIAGIFDVHPETKESTGILKRFTVTGGDTGTATATSITISPAIIVSGPHQNCIGASAAADPSDGDAITFLEDATANNQSLLFQKGFAAFATADLILPKGTDMASRQVYDGISMRLIRDYDVVKDRILTRIDVLYGFKVLRPQLGVVLHDD